MTDETADAVREDVIESMERSAEVYGLSRSAGRVYGVLYFAGESLSISELVEETGYAKSTISTVTRKLDRVGLVRRRSSGGGGRRVEFEPETDLWFVVQDVVRQYAHREVQVTQRTLTDALGRIDESDAVESDDGERIAELAATYEEFERLLDLLTEHTISDVVAALEAYEE